jgi:exodeoxyribonuclease VII large subunit
MEQKLSTDQQRLKRLESQLRMLNPLAVLGRGYSVTFKADGSVVRAAEDVTAGDQVVTKVGDGEFTAEVK